MRTRLQRGPRGCPPAAQRAAVIQELTAAEAAVLDGNDPAVLASEARSLSGAETVWIRLEAGEDLVRSGSRRNAADVSALLAPDAAGPRQDAAARGTYLFGLGPGGVIVFGYDAASAEAALTAEAVAQWALLRAQQRSLASESDRAARAELRALRAQISPHFAFNAMGAIAALIRIDPERAHGLLLDFADYTRYSFGRRGDYTTLADELRAIETYLSLERARFGSRLGVHVTVAPEVLTVAIPFLVLQPLVENAIRHGIEPVPRGGTVQLRAEEVDSDVCITIEDDGAGADPDMLEEVLAGLGPHDRDHVGLRNVDERLRAVYGDAHGLLVETGPGAGTRITLRIPKYRPGVTV